VQGMGGIMSITGHPGGPPTRVGTSVGDITAGLFTTIGINAALYHRAATGHGMKIDVAMLDCQIAILENAIARYAATGTAPGPLGARHPSITPFAAYQAQDGWIIIAAGNNGLFEKLCGVLERPDMLADPDFASNDLRTTNAERLAHEMEFALRRDTVANWMAKLEAAGVPHGPINNVQQALNDPHVRARNMVVTVDDPVTGTLEIAGMRVTMTSAVHSSSVVEDGRIIYLGTPAGFVLRAPDMPTTYVAGDTDLFADMKTIGQLYKPQIAFLPIGDLYTMGPETAAVAAEWLGVRQIVPMHWGTFPALTGTPDALRQLVAPHNIEVLEISPGETAK